MSTEQLPDETVTLSARNVGGISETEVSFERGVTVLKGRNATNRTSLLRAAMLALGSEHASLKGGTDEGHVQLCVGDERYTRTLTRHGDTVELGGSPYLDDPTVADLFAFLLEGNEARRAVARGADLREVIMRPIDTDAIEAEIQRLEAERREVDAALTEFDDLERRLDDLESREEALDVEVDEKRAELDAVEAELAALDTSVEESREDRDELDARLDELHDARSELDRLDRRIETETDSIDSLEAERAEVDATLDSTATDDEAEFDAITTEIERLRERKRTLDGVVSELQNVVQFNEEMLDGGKAEVRAALDGDETATDRLLDDRTACWTCGSEVEQSQITATLDRLRSFRSEKFDAIREVEDRLDDLREQRAAVAERRETRADAEARLERLDDELTTRRERLDDLRGEREALSEELGELEAAVEKLESEEFSHILAKHKRANEVEFEIGRLEREYEDVAEELVTVEERLAERTALNERREALSEALVDARTRIEDLESAAVDAFNDHIDTVLSLLGYDNVERIWIERVEESVREGRRTVDATRFELHVVRTNEDGRAYEDTVDHLSESEREVTGLVFALAGYLVHDVHETLPFIVLDSLEAIDSSRIATLVEYFSEYAEFSVVALLPEDERALDGDYRRVSDI